MKKLIIAAVVVLTVSFTSCSKQDNFEQAKADQIKSVTDDVSGLNTFLTYSNKLDISQADGSI